MEERGMFANAQVPLSALPSAAQLEWHPVDARLIRCQQMQALVVWGPVLAIAGIGLYLASAVGGWIDARFASVCWVLLAVLALRALIALLWPLLAVPRLGFCVRERDILYKSGVIWRSVTAVPYNRVQHAATNSRPLERRFDLARLVVYTAGGAGGDLTIPGLPAPLAERLRRHVLQQLGAETEDAEGAAEDAAMAHIHEGAADAEGADARAAG